MNYWIMAYIAAFGILAVFALACTLKFLRTKSAQNR